MVYAITGKYFCFKKIYTEWYLLDIVNKIKRSSNGKHTNGNDNLNIVKQNRKGRFRPSVVDHINTVNAALYG